MATAIYNKFLEAQLNGASNIDMIGGTVKVALIDVGAYAFSQTHQFLSDVAGGAILGTSNALTSKTYTAGQFDADDATVPVPSATSAEALIIYIDTGSAATSRLIIFIDSGQGLPFTPDGVNDMFIIWDNSGIIQF